jgi:hypothetical protein
MADYTNYYTLDRLNGEVACISDTIALWFTQGKLSQFADSIVSSHMLLHKDIEILYESNCAYDIIKAQKSDVDNVYVMYIVKTLDKLLALVTCQTRKERTTKVVYEFEFVPALIFHDSLEEILEDIIKPFEFYDETQEADCQAIDILQTLRAHSLLLLCKMDTGVGNKFKRLLADQIQF